MFVPNAHALFCTPHTRQNIKHKFRIKTFCISKVNLNLFFQQLSEYFQTTFSALHRAFSAPHNTFSKTRIFYLTALPKRSYINFCPFLRIFALSILTYTDNCILDFSVNNPYPSPKSPPLPIPTLISPILKNFRIQYICFSKKICLEIKITLAVEGSACGGTICFYKKANGHLRYLSPFSVCFPAFRRLRYRASLSPQTS